MKTTLVKTCMSQPVVFVTSQTKISEAHDLMIKKRIRRLPVIDGGQLVGIVTLLDASEARPADAETLRPTALKAYIAMMKVEEIMARHPVTVSPTSTVLDVARLMARHKISGVPVVEQGHVVGMITESDVFRAIVAMADEELRMPSKG